MGAKFLHVDFKESGDGAGGYAKEMSAEWFAAADKMLLKECANTNVIITTALIPGRKAPVLISKAMVEAMPAGSVTVDLAAEAGGNIACTVPGKVVNIGNNVTVIGYTNMPARMANTASTLFGGNVSNLILSMDVKDKFTVDEVNDTAVRSMLVVKQGVKFAPYVPPPKPVVVEEKKEVEVVNVKLLTMRKAYSATMGLTAFMGFGALVPGAGTLSTFVLSMWVGSQAVKGVSHALHSPLMSVTNAIR